MKKETHETRLLAYLKEHGSITSREAIHHLDNTRLAATVCVLRDKGHKITTSTLDVHTRWEKNVRVAVYTLDGVVKSKGFWSFLKRKNH